MTCRCCRDLLSAYLDSELAADERAGVQSHLETCAACNVEYRALAETKRALASLGARVSREEIERLLQTDVGETVRRYANMPVSPRTITAAILSVIGLCVATARITSRESRRGTPLPEGAYLISQPDLSGKMHYSILEVRNIPPMPAETCILVPSNGMLFCAPTPPPANRNSFYFQASFTTH